jgi:hypothetical protein
MLLLILHVLSHGKKSLNIIVWPLLHQYCPENAEKSFFSGFIGSCNTRSRTSFILRRSSLVWDASIYWFGSFSTRLSFNWIQGTVDSISNLDSAVSFSWQNIVLPSGASASRSLIVKFGTFDSTRVAFRLIFPSVSSIYYLNSLQINGSVSSSNNTDTVRLLLEVDGDPSQLFVTNISVATPETT